ncbi:MAG TPA: hypothetical protein PLL18_04815, partial [Flavobacteriales bacterium]|nr:hypothetical protein [Flavobacteriales bacterium]
LCVQVALGIANVLLLLPLASCLTAKEYQRPGMATDALYRMDLATDSVAPTMDSASLAQVSWRNLFPDPVLKQYVQQALDRNLDVRIALRNT